MNLENVKDTLWDVVSGFFQGATVVWAEQIATQPRLPYVTLKVRNPERNVHILVDDDGSKNYSCSVLLELNLYTKGKPFGKKAGSTTNYINTAISDMADFFVYLDSDEGLLLQQSLGISMELEGQIQDLSSLENDTQYRYRSMAEIRVGYIQNVAGSYGLENVSQLPNYSGGGIEEMKAGDYIIEEAEIEEVEDD